jgi:hypothetical protein
MCFSPKESKISIWVFHVPSSICCAVAPSGIIGMRLSRLQAKSTFVVAFAGSFPPTGIVRSVTGLELSITEAPPTSLAIHP